MSQQTMNYLRDCLPIFEMLGDENRQNIAILLFANDRLNVGELTDMIHLSRPAVSHHLKLMLYAELVEVAQKGKERYYRLKAEATLQRLKNLTNSLENDIKNRESK